MGKTGRDDSTTLRQRLALAKLLFEGLITDRALFNFDAQTKEMVLIEVAQGETAVSIQKDVGWPLRISPDLKEMTPPTKEELTITREKLDPQGMYR